MPYQALFWKPFSGQKHPLPTSPHTHTWREVRPLLESAFDFIPGSSGQAFSNALVLKPTSGPSLGQPKALGSALCLSRARLETISSSKVLGSPVLCFLAGKVIMYSNTPSTVENILAAPRGCEVSTETAVAEPMF